MRTCQIRETSSIELSVALHAWHATLLLSLRELSNRTDLLLAFRLHYKEYLLLMTSYRAQEHVCDLYWAAFKMFISINAIQSHRKSLGQNTDTHMKTSQRLLSIILDQNTTEDWKSELFGLITGMTGPCITQSAEMNTVSSSERRLSQPSHTAGNKTEEFPAKKKTHQLTGALRFHQ